MLALRSLVSETGGGCEGTAFFCPEARPHAAAMKLLDHGNSR